MRHIFGQQFEFGLDYLQLLYLYPTQKLPALLLVSNANRTGKTTFVNFLADIFGENARVLTNEDLNSRFNAYYANGLIAAIDEANIKSSGDVNKVKSLITSKTLFVEAKGADRYTIQNNLHIIGCSNDTQAAILIDKNDRRFWVRDVGVPTKHDVLLPEKMQHEIPAFLDFLIKRKLSSPNEDRLYFKPEKLATDALRRIVAHSETTIHSEEKDLAELVMSLMDRTNQNEVSLTLGDMQKLASNGRMNLSTRQIRLILVNWFADGPINSSFTSFLDEEGKILTKQVNRKGRYYCFTRSLLIDKL